MRIGDERRLRSEALRLAVSVTAVAAGLAMAPGVAIAAGVAIAPGQAARELAPGPDDPYVMVLGVAQDGGVPQAGQAVRLNCRLTVTPFLVPHRQEYSEVVGFRIEGPSRSVLYLPDIDSWEEWEARGTAIEARGFRVAREGERIGL